MLSILIPTYNYNVFPLVSELQSQCKACEIDYEIISFDDGSDLFHSENHQVNSLENCSYAILEKNIGRSAIRNLLATKARFENLLFLDADVFPKNDNFIEYYVQQIDGIEKVVSGGLAYPENKPEKKLMLRWTYGSQREVFSRFEREKNPYQSFLSSNFLTTKKLFKIVSFNEEIPDLRREDTLYSYNLMKQNISVKHIENPVYHLGIDLFEIAIRKENESLDGLKYMLNHHLLPYDYLKISRLYLRIKNLGLTSVVAQFHKLTRSFLLKNLSSGRPSLRIFDLYRIGYLCLPYQPKR